ncbi:hypothetical protein NE236_07960 [Actinoallomurus purpureus]|uniref:hypothetical protein n=1 Tax=Actinoallomurus purpureus TaxID=478114 RepID=UPI002092D0A6|nr:hypothetical protein [Actinoallomurus purpureus]MCO6004913.1 hypothetical protein [Actinoallomurus purpureus]
MSISRRVMLPVTMAAVTVVSGAGVASAGTSTADVAAPAPSAGNVSAAAAPGLGSAVVLGKTEIVFSSTSSHTDKALAARVIHCEMVFIGANHGAPHHSGHVPGTVNVRVRVTCTKPIRMIRGKIGLFSSHGSKIKAYSSVGRATAKGNAALVCRTGYYQGESAAQLTAPPGYSPPTVNIGAKTAKVHLKKC